jgi:hypothetical protein
VPEVDRYLKKIKTKELIQLLVNAQVDQVKSLREISNSLNCDALSQFINQNSFSASQFSRRLRDLPTRVPEILFSGVINKLGRQIGCEAVRQNIGRLNLIDSTTISLCLSDYKWAKFRRTKSGVKLHLGLRFADNLLSAGAIITAANKADRTQMDSLIDNTPDVVNVFDRPYVDYSKFDEFCCNNIRFVSRLNENAYVEVLKESIAEEDSPIEED